MQISGLSFHTTAADIPYGFGTHVSFKRMYRDESGEQLRFQVCRRAKPSSHSHCLSVYIYTLSRVGWYA
jgi:hypothetical protein